MAMPLFSRNFIPKPETCRITLMPQIANENARSKHNELECYITVSKSNTIFMLHNANKVDKASKVLSI